MNILEKLKEWISKIKGNTVKALPEPTQVDYSPAAITKKIQEKRNDFTTSISKFEKDLESSPNTIEYAIDQYMKATFHSYTLRETIDSYRAVTSLGSLTSQGSMR